MGKNNWSDNKLRFLKSHDNHLTALCEIPSLTRTVLKLCAQSCNMAESFSLRMAWIPRCFNNGSIAITSVHSILCVTKEDYITEELIALPDKLIMSTLELQCTKPLKSSSHDLWLALIQKHEMRNQFSSICVRWENLKIITVCPLHKPFFLCVCTFSPRWNYKVLQPFLKRN